MNNLSFLNEYLPLWGVCAFPEGIALLKTRKALPENPKSVIVAAFPYLLPEECYAGRNVARFAVPRDYHEVCGARLEQACKALRAHCPGEDFVHFCDHSPLPEVALAEHTGLGWRGRHNLLITPKYGSWVVLGEIVTTVALPVRNAKCLMLNCDGCHAPCVAACPTGALSRASFDKFKCLSYCSQRKGKLAPEIAVQLRRTHTAWGCDLCQEACVRNRNVVIDPQPEFLQSAVPMLTAETSIEGRAYAWRGREMLDRNVENLNEK